MKRVNWAGRCVCVLCLLVLNVPAGWAQGLGAESSAESPSFLGVGVGAGLGYIPTLRLEVRPLPWVSIAARVGLVSGLNAHGTWEPPVLPSVGGQVSGIWPWADGHSVAARFGADIGFQFGVVGTLYWVSPDSFFSLDGSLGWAWQRGAWEVRVDLGVAYVEEIVDEPGERSVNDPRWAPTLMVSGLYWLW